MENKRLGRGLDQIADLFLSADNGFRPSSPKTTTDESFRDSDDPPAGGNEGTSLNVDPNDTRLLTDLCDVEEKVTIHKNITYPHVPDIREKILKLVCQYLEADYDIKRIELMKSSRNCKPGKNKVTEEIICISVEDPPPIMDF